MLSAATLRLSLRRVVQALFSQGLGIGLGIVVSARFAWLFSHAEKWDTPAAMPALILCELPMVFCLVALTTGLESKRTLRSAGIAFGTAACFCVIWLPLGFDAGFTAWEDRGGYLATLEKFLWVCLAYAVWTLIISWGYGKGQRRAFGMYVLIGITCFVLVFSLINAAAVKGSGEAKEKMRFQPPAPRPEFHVQAVAACLIRHHFLHPDEGFPSSLAEIRPDWNCDWKLSDPWTLYKYWVYYSPVDHSPRGFQDFRIASVFTDDRAWLVSAADKRGEVISLQGAGLSAAERTRQRLPFRTADADANILHTLFSVRDDVKRYMDTHDPANAPSSLDVAVDPQRLRSFCDEAGNPQDHVIGKGYLCFNIAYFPPTATPPATFAISLQCVSYGDGCLRSYFLDYDGTIHATFEPRAATNQDPGLLPCEASQSGTVPCNDPVWTSGEISPWTFMRAKFLSVLH
jgi:hypothetical protein